MNVALAGEEGDPPASKATVPCRLPLLWKRMSRFCGLYDVDAEGLMVNSTEEDLDIQGFSATHPVARFFLQESTEQEYRKANFRAWGKSIRVPLIIVIIGECMRTSCRFAAAPPRARSEVFHVRDVAACNRQELPPFCRGENPHFTTLC